MRKWLSIATRISVLLLLLLSCPVVAGASGTDVTGSIPFAVFNIEVRDVTSSVAVVTWDTNSASTSQVYYGTAAGSYSFWTAVSDTNPGVSHHSVFLSGLSASTTYHYQVWSAIDIFTIYAISQDYTFVTQPDSLAGGGSSGGGGGGGSSGELIVSTGDLLPTGRLSVTSAGAAQTDVRLETQDHTALLNIATGTSLLDINSRPLTAIYANPITTIPGTPPEGTIALAYEFGPSGARFSPPLTLTLSYEAAGLPGNTPGDLLHILFWDGTQWVEIASTVDTSAHTISARLSHFSAYMLLKDAAPAPTISSPAAKPAVNLIPPMPPSNLPGIGPGTIYGPTPKSNPSSSAASNPAANPAAKPTPSRPEAAAPESNQSSSASRLILISVWIFVVVAGATAVFVSKRANSGRI